MKWPWQHSAEIRKRSTEAANQVEEARVEYERTVQNGLRVADVFSSLFYHAERNEIVENIQKVARGRS